MFKNIELKNFIKWVRIQNMEVMKICLLNYKRTGDEAMLEWAKVFGKWSEAFKE
jgi:hypothetical protein